jgi:hypothetical protein
MAAASYTRPKGESMKLLALALLLFVPQIAVPKGCMQWVTFCVQHPGHPNHAFWKVF